MTAQAPQSGPISLFIRDEYIISLAHIIAVKWVPAPDAGSRTLRVRRGNQNTETKVSRRLEVLGAIDREFRLTMTEEIGQELIVALISYHELFYSRKAPV